MNGNRSLLIHISYTDGSRWSYTHRVRVHAVDVATALRLFSEAHPEGSIRSVEVKRDTTSDIFDPNLSLGALT